MKEMFKGKVNSPVTYLKEAVTQEGTILYLASNSVLPDELPNLLVIGEDENAETVKVLNIRVDGGLDVERGFQGISKAWGKTTQVARNITEYDIGSLQENIKKLNEEKIDITDVSTVGKSGQYDDLINKPDIPDLIGKAIAQVTDNAPEALDTLYEISKALGDDPDFKNTILGEVGKKVDKSNVVKTLQEIIDNADEEKLKELIPSGFALKQLFQNVDNGKELLANAIIDKGGSGVSKESTWEALYDGILNIKTGYGIGDIVLLENLEEHGEFRPSDLNLIKNITLDDETTHVKGFKNTDYFVVLYRYGVAVFNSDLYSIKTSKPYSNYAGGCLITEDDKILIIGNNSTPKLMLLDRNLNLEKETIISGITSTQGTSIVRMGEFYYLTVVINNQAQILKIDNNLNVVKIINFENFEHIIYSSEIMVTGDNKFIIKNQSNYYEYDSNLNKVKTTKSATSDHICKVLNNSIIEAGPASISQYDFNYGLLKKAPMLKILSYPAIEYSNILKIYILGNSSGEVVLLDDELKIVKSVIVNSGKDMRGLYCNDKNKHIFTGSESKLFDIEILTTNKLVGYKILK